MVEAATYRAPAGYRDRSPGRWQHDPTHRRGVAYRGVEVQQRFADARTRPDSGTYLDRENARRQDPQRAQSYPRSNRSRDADRPAVQAEIQSHGSSQAQAAIQQGAQPYPISTRQRESYNDVRRTAVPQVRDTAVQPVIQPVAGTQPHSGNNAGADRRDQVRGVDRGDRRQPVESRQATRPADVHPQTQGNRGNATLSHSDQSERSAKSHAGKSSQEPPSPAATRHEAQRGVERHKEVQKKPEARPDSGWRRGASAEKALPQ